MKKHLTVVALFLTATLALGAQQHISFKGVPLGQDRPVVVAALQERGFTTVADTDLGTVLKGDFAGHRDCDVFVLSTDRTQAVWKVSVNLPESSSWTVLKLQYNTFKTSFSKKYGTVGESYEFFKKPYYEGDGYELSAISREKGFWSTYYTVPGGTVLLEVSASGPREGNVTINYEDLQTVEILKAERAAQTEKDL